MKAIILAAGQGTRLRPVTLTTPKPLVPVANRPLIAYAVEMLKLGGMSEVGIVVNSLDSMVVERIGDGRGLGVNVQYIVQAEQRGLAHAVGLTREFIGDDTFALFLGDNIFQDKMEPLLRNFGDSDYEAAIALAEVSDPTRFGIAEVRDDSIVRVVEKPKQPPSNLAIAGVYLFRPSIFEAIEKIQPSWRNEYEITDAIQVLLTEGRRVQAYKVQGWWIDAGKPDAIIHANELVLSELPYTPSPDYQGIEGNSQVGARCILGRNVKIINSVVRGPVIIGDNVTIRNSYIGPYTALGDNSVIENSEIEASIVMRDCTIRNIAGRIDSSLLADNSQVQSAPHVPVAHRFVLAENSYVQF